MKAKLIGKNEFIIILICLFVFFFRQYTSLSFHNEFDDKQIYLLGLKFFTSGAWPYFGPDVVWSKSQIPGALIPLLTGAPLFIWMHPAAPIVFMNIMAFAALLFFAWYSSKRFALLPPWFIYAWILLSPFSLKMATRLYNPGHVIIFSIFFLIGFIENMGFYKQNILPKKVSAFLIGASFLALVQTHHSVIMLLPFVLFCLFRWFLAKERKIDLTSFGFFCMGALVLGSLLIPTIIKYGPFGLGTAGNFNFEFIRAREFFPFFFKVLAYASHDMPYVIKLNAPERADFFLVYKNIRFLTIFLTISSWLMTAWMFLAFFVKKSKHAHPNWNHDFKTIKIIFLCIFLSLFIARLFANVPYPIRVYAFSIVFPFAFYYSLYSYERLLQFKGTKTFFSIFFLMVILASVVHSSFENIYNRKTSFLAEEGEKIEQALTEKDSSILGLRRYEILIQKGEAIHPGY